MLQPLSDACHDACYLPGIWGTLLSNALQQNSIPHFLLFAGRTREPIEAVAKQFACEYLSIKTAHPDLLEFRVEGKLALHPIAAIHRLREELSYTPFASDRRVAILYDGDKMLAPAANALLKMLEEPPTGTLLIFTTTHLERLLPTIRSRATIVRVPISVPLAAPPHIQPQSESLFAPLVQSLVRMLAKSADHNSTAHNSASYSPGLLTSLDELQKLFDEQLKLKTNSLNPAFNLDQDDARLSFEQVVSQGLAKEVLELIWQEGTQALYKQEASLFAPFTEPRFLFQSSFGKRGAFTNALQAIEKGASLQNALLIAFRQHVMGHR